MSEEAKKYLKQYITVNGDGIVSFDSMLKIMDGFHSKELERKLVVFTDEKIVSIGSELLRTNNMNAPLLEAYKIGAKTILREIKEL